MSTFSQMYEERLCRICHGYDVEWFCDHLVLYQTSTRTYAHPHCMVEKFGLKEALKRVRHDWQKKQFKRALKFPVVKGKDHPMVLEMKRSTR